MKWRRGSWRLTTRFVRKSVELRSVGSRAGLFPSNFTAAERMGMGDFVALETERHQRITASEDCQEAFRAFVEKRAPRYAGR